MKAQLDPRSFVIATYALCGFANFSSIASQIGGIARWPEPESDLGGWAAGGGGGSMANFMSASLPECFSMIGRPRSGWTAARDCGAAGGGAGQRAAGIRPGAGRPG